MVIKRFQNNICEYIINDNIVILSNKLNGHWIKIPVECYTALKYSWNNNIDPYDLVGAFDKSIDKTYYLEMLEMLKTLGLVSDSEYEFNSIHKVTFSFTNSCNLSCDYCSAESGIDNVDYLHSEDMKIIIDNIIQLAPKVIVISGGEPLMRNDFFELLAYMRCKYSGKIVLATNATLITKKAAKLLVEMVDFIEISLDGYDEESVSYIRGKGVYDKVVTVIKELKSLKFEEISVSMIVGKNNEAHIGEFIGFCNRLGVKPVIRNFFNLGRGTSNSNKYLDNDSDIFHICDDDYIDTSSLVSNRCKAGHNQISIDRSGNVYPCPNLEFDRFKILNLLESNIKISDWGTDSRVSNIRRKVESLKTYNLNRCSGCNISLFCMPCPAIICNMIEDEKKFNYNCEKMKHYITRLVWEDK